MVKSNWRRLILVAGVSIGLNSTTFVLAIFVLSYATAERPRVLDFLGPRSSGEASRGSSCTVSRT
ncbi:hypothetical protein BJF84_12465 [Rhodococcus sp. CUA-806]|nr:hypothetical protein BJF84_12465 [Rhodococcus sp. CUA-806]